MCTVTFVPTQNGVYLTSNRDEKSMRQQATHPQTYIAGGCKLLFPKDGDAGGSWIAVKENGDAAVLLNGAFVNHVPQKHYRKSRGLVLLDVLSAENPLRYLRLANFEGVQPFTMVLYTHQSLYDCRWDGERKHVSMKDTSAAHIWSSVTLYDDQARCARVERFQRWRSQAVTVDYASIFNLHRFGEVGDPANDFVMNRNREIYTVSITSVFLTKNDASMRYTDLIENTTHTEHVAIRKKQQVEKKSFSLQLQDRFKRKWIIARHWEYWPFHVVYGPLYLYWFYLSLKARSFFFFSQANPSIENAGFTNERKSLIYALLPERYYPKTVLCNTNLNFADLQLLLHERSITFPMIAKPDIGEKGAKVKRLCNEEELHRYWTASKVDFLVQELVDYPNEVGIFYYRVPGEQYGRISGIVGKEFLAVTGDGVSTIEELVRKNDRFFLQLPGLKQELGDFLQTVLADQESFELVPYGNHARGAKFIDLSDHIGPALTKTIDDLCRQVDGFYFGRLDIRFRSWPELEQGIHFSVIELNGAGSEPTHIYDPRHSLFFAWKEIIRHWHILYRISQLNARNNGTRLMGTRQGLQLLSAHSNYMKQLSIDRN